MKQLLLTLTLLMAAFPAGADVHLLGSPQVRRELGISHDLAGRILNNLNEAARLNQGGVMMQQQFEQLQTERKATPPETLERQIMTWLSPAQKQRLEQIELQRGGPFIFEDWRFAQRVGLSLEQHKKLNLIFSAAFQRELKAAQALSKANKSWFGVLDHKRYASKYSNYYRKLENFGKQRQLTIESALNHSLTQTQKAKWRALLGKPFRARLSYDVKSYPMD
ncbi:hypothetical protein EON83_23590 [bacterium]|nr:MAG: hypothetical protein EON83_23590 [bacterium]